MCELKYTAISNLSQISNLLSSAAGGPAAMWCCIDEMGSIHLLSETIADFVGIPRDGLKSLYQFNPEWSYMSWQDILKKVGAASAKSFDTKYLHADGNIRDCLVQLIRFKFIEKNYILYVLHSNSEPKKVSDKQQPEHTDTVDSALTYDDLAPNGVLYFSEEGTITYANKVMIDLNDPAVDKRNVKDLFLESEIGPLVKGLQNHPNKEQEVIIRMVMKSKKGMIDGFARCSIHDPEIAKNRFRTEFLILDAFKLIDRPLEDAMADLERVKEDIQTTKVILAQEKLEDFSFQNILTRSPRYKSVLGQVAQVADTMSTVLITGETGTGKELLSSAVYSLSDRSDKLFIKVNCASIPKELVESILFGHEKGAFTGADSKKIGKFELADGGTIFLDEIGEMPLELQPKLLRVLQEGEIERIGNPQPIKVDVRVIAATNRNLEKLAKEGKFREDLYYRLNVFPIYNIPLRDRKEDIPLLVNHFLEKMNKKMGRNVKEIKTKDLQILTKLDYPGNVRELENIIARAVVLSAGDVADLDFLTSQITGGPQSSAFLPFEEMIKQHIIKSLEMTDGKVTGDNSASELLNINGKTLASKLRKYSIDPREYRV